jgi:hypothetical protein
MICTHGMPTAASCITCMEDGPVAPPTPAAEQKLRAEHWIAARYDGRCARRHCEIEAGECIGMVENVGWCCSGCAK